MEVPERPGQTHACHSGQATASPVRQWPPPSERPAALPPTPRQPPPGSDSRCSGQTDTSPSDGQPAPVRHTPASIGPRLCLSDAGPLRLTPAPSDSRRSPQTDAGPLRQSPAPSDRRRPPQTDAGPLRLTPVPSDRRRPPQTDAGSPHDTPALPVSRRCPRTHTRLPGQTRLSPPTHTRLHRARLSPSDAARHTAAAPIGPTPASPSRPPLSVRDPRLPAKTATAVTQPAPRSDPGCPRDGHRLPVGSCCRGTHRPRPSDSAVGHRHLTQSAGHTRAFRHSPHDGPSDASPLPSRSGAAMLG